MADTLVDGAAHGALEDVIGVWGPYWADKDNGVIIFPDSSLDMTSWYTSNGGANWTETAIESGSATTQQVAAWFDKETPGNTGTLLHVVWANSFSEALFYITVDAADGTLGTKRTIDGTLTVGFTAGGNRVAITKTKGGNLLAAISTQSEIGTYRSIDAGANWTSIGTVGDVFETATEEDWVFLFPANTADDDDACAIFWDRSANIISVKMFDDSADTGNGTWTETSIASSMDNHPFIKQLDGVIRHSDGKLLLAAWNDGPDSATADILTWEIAVDSIASPTVTAKANVVTNMPESGGLALWINQQTDEVRAVYLNGGTWFSLTDVVFHISSDGMGTWGTEQPYSQTTDDLRMGSAGRSVDNSGGRFQPAWYNDDTKNVLVNLVFDVEIAAGVSDQSVDPASVDAVARVVAPSISGSGAATVIPSSVDAVARVIAPVVAGSGAAVVTPDSVGAVARVNGPAQIQIGVTPASVAGVARVVAPVVAGSGAAQATPDSVAAVARVPAPTVAGTGAAAVAPVSVAAVARIPAPSVLGSGAAPITPSSVDAVARVVAPVVAGSGAGAVTPASVAAIARVNAPVVVGSGATAVTPDSVNAVARVGTVIVVAVVRASPASVLAVARVNAPTVAGTGVGTVTLASVNAIARLSTPSISGSGVSAVAPASVDAVSRVNAPILAGSGAAAVTPGSVDAVARINALVIAGSGASAVAPASVNALARVGTPALEAEQFVTPVSVTAVARVNTPILAGTGAAAAVPNSVDAVARIPTLSIAATGAAVLLVASVGAFARIPAPTAGLLVTVRPDSVGAFARIVAPVIVQVFRGQLSATLDAITTGAVSLDAKIAVTGTLDAKDADSITLPDIAV